MRYQIIAVGALKRGFYKDGAGFYGKRLSAYGKLELLEIKEGKGQDPEGLKQQEGEALLRAAGGHLVSLDERGEMLSSKGLAEKLGALELRGISQLSLLIGGAEGHGQAVRQAVAESWSLSKLTLPHELARLLLLEQLYRAETIRAGHPYHRE